MRTITCFVTCGSLGEAEGIARALLGKKLIACANIIPRIESFYRWKGKTGKSREALLIAKTRKSLKKKLAVEIEKLHSYELPAMEFFETELSPRAKKWVENETKK